jgi:hypothetical protein
VKLLRTFAAQTETLQRYRGKQQKVTVEHVHVRTAGQAIVGSVSQSGRERDNDENRGQPLSWFETELTELCHAAIRFDYRRGPGPY